MESIPLWSGTVGGVPERVSFEIEGRDVFIRVETGEQDGESSMRLPVHPTILFQASQGKQVRASAAAGHCDILPQEDSFRMELRLVESGLQRAHNVDGDTFQRAVRAVTYHRGEP